MLATIRDDTWNVFNIQHITPNWKRWATERLKDLPTWLNVATTLEKLPTHTHIKYSNIDKKNQNTNCNSWHLNVDHCMMFFCMKTVYIFSQWLSTFPASANGMTWITNTGYCPEITCCAGAKLTVQTAKWGFVIIISWNGDSNGKPTFNWTSQVLIFLYLVVSDDINNYIQNMFIRNACLSLISAFLNLLYSSLPWKTQHKLRLN